MPPPVPAPSDNGRVLGAPDTLPLFASLLLPGIPIIGKVLDAYPRKTKDGKLIACYDVYTEQPMKTVLCQVWDMAPDLHLKEQVCAFRVTGIRWYEESPQFNVAILGIMPTLDGVLP